MDINNLPNNQNLNNTNPTTGTPNENPTPVVNNNVNPLPNNAMDTTNLSNSQTLNNPNPTPVTPNQNPAPEVNNSVNPMPDNTTNVASTSNQTIPNNESLNSINLSNPTPSNTPVNTVPQTLETTPLTGETPNQPQPNPVPQTLASPNLDNFNAVPVPPAFADDSKKKDKKNNKTMTIVLLILMVVAIGGGLYYFLVLAKNQTPKVPSVTIVPKEVHLNLKEEIPTDPTLYADITGIDVSNCIVNTEAINKNLANAYNFQVTCNDKMEIGTVIVEDTKKPEVVLNDLEVTVGTIPNVEDFIDYCIDASNCTYKITNDLTTLVTAPGTYDVNISVTDAYNNQNDVTAKLIVGNSIADTYITCTANPMDVDSIFATQVNTYKIGFNNNLFHNAIKTSKFTFEQIADYNAQVNSYDATKGINHVIGTNYNDVFNKTIIIKQSQNFNELVSDFGANLSSQDINVIRSYLMFQGYTCE